MIRCVSDKVHRDKVHRDKVHRDKVHRDKVCGSELICLVACRR